MAGELNKNQIPKQFATLAGLDTGALGFDPMFVSSGYIPAGAAPADDVTIMAAMPTVPAAGVSIAFSVFYTMSGAGTVTLRDTAGGGGAALGGAHGAGTTGIIGTGNSVASAAAVYLRRSTGVIEGRLLIFWKAV